MNYQYELLYYFHQIVKIVIVIIMILIVSIVALYFKDKYRKKPYNLKPMHRRLERVGQSSDDYILYWIWQRNKKVQAMEKLNRGGVTRVYFRHARKRNYDVKSKIPFLHEAYGKAND